MSELKICRICLTFEAKVFKFNSYQLKSYYEEILDFKVDDNDGLPHYFCFECSTMLHKFHRFKEKCFTGQKVLKGMLWQGKITYESVYKVNRKKLNLASPLDINRGNIFILHDIEKITAEKDYNKIEDENVDIIGDIEDSLDIMESIEQSPIVEVKTKEFSEKDDSSPDDDPSNSDRGQSPETVCINKVDQVQKSVKLKSKKKKKRHHTTTLLQKLLDEGHWKKIALSEEKALKAFHARSEEKKYITATNRCTDCYKTFSKAEMLVRHRELRHNESLGPFECQFCKMRFKRDCFLRKHMREHYAKYECLRCNLVCSLESTVLLHEDYHSGITKKCIHCDEEFRHASTYYSHLRTHRSNHLCTLCGISFVSDIGLRMHKRKKHCVDDMDSPDDDEDMNTFCARCDIRFETRKAYEQHLVQSTSHVNEKKTFKASNGIVVRKKYRKLRKKPSTCHQCGEHFDTLTACMKHHQTEHPRTAFYPSAERHICEICGASLAPGSMASHQNTHTRETLHPCDICGKQFNTVGSLKRHMVTHTGEKPFVCDVCDKRFTQSCAVKLHYRTVHLREPWPKRNRKKKKDNPPERMDTENTEEDSDDCALSKTLEKRIKTSRRVAE